MRLAALFLTALSAFAQYTPAGSVAPVSGGGGTGAFSLVGTPEQHKQTTQTTSITLTVTSNPTIGHLYTLKIAGGQGSSATSSITSCTDSQGSPNTYTVRVQKAHGSTTAVFAAIVDTTITATSASYTVTCTANLSDFFLIVGSEYSFTGTLGVAGTDSHDDNNTTTYPCGTVTDGTAGRFALSEAMLGTNYGSTVFAQTAGSGWTIPTNGLSTNGGSTVVGGTEYQLISSTSGAYAPTFTASAAIRGTCVSVLYDVH